MITEIIHEIVDWFCIVIIIAFGMLHCAVYNVEATWDEWYQNYEYNLDCDCDDGFYDAIIRPN